MSVGLNETVKEHLSPWKSAVVSWVNGDWPDLTNRQLALLMIISFEPGTHLVRTLAARLGVTKPIISGVLDRLSDLGLMTRVHDRRDRRDVFAVPTPRANEFFIALDQLMIDDATL